MWENRFCNRLCSIWSVGVMCWYFEVFVMTRANEFWMRWSLLRFSFEMPEWSGGKKNINAKIRKDVRHNLHVEHRQNFSLRFSFLHLCIYLFILFIYLYVICWLFIILCLWNENYIISFLNSLYKTSIFLTVMSINPATGSRRLTFHIGRMHNNSIFTARYITIVISLNGFHFF